MLKWIKKFFHKDENHKIKVVFELDKEKSHEELVDEHNFEEDIIELEKQFYSSTKVSDEGDFIWGLVGNIVEKHPFGENKEIRYGTKHFLPNAKVYILPSIWDDGYEKLRVIGRHRKTNKYVCMIIKTKYITNFRLKKIYSPYIIKAMSNEKGCTNSQQDKKTIEEIAIFLSEQI